MIRDTYIIPNTGTPQTVFPLSALPGDSSQVTVYRNGMLMHPGADYALTAGPSTYTVGFVSGQVIDNGDLVQIIYPAPGSSGSGSSSGLPAQNFLYRALRKCGQMRPGYLPSADLLADGLAEWLAMFDGWNAERTLNYSMPDYVYPVTGPGSGTTGNGQTFGGSGYQIGPTAADFVGPRPVAIAKMNLLLTSVPGTPARVPLSPISMEEWTSIAVVQLTPTNVTTVYAYDPQWPNGVIWLWPPLIGNSLEIFEWGQLAPPANLTSLYSAPPGYDDAIVWSLAERLWPLCTHDIMPHKLSLQYIVGKAVKARDKIKAVNAPMPRITSDFRGRGSNVGGGDLNLLISGRPY